MDIIHLPQLDGLLNPTSKHYSIRVLRRPRHTWIIHSSDKAAGCAQAVVDIEGRSATKSSALPMT
jgi:hypothetical protein